MLHVVRRTDTSRVQFFLGEADLLKELQTPRPDFPSSVASRCDAGRSALVRKMLSSTVPMDAEALRLELAVGDAYRFWRRLENLPRFMAHLHRVTDTIINEVENEVIGWRSLAGSDVKTAGSVNFDTARDGRSTHVSVHLPATPSLT
jgi:hypothetical protein